MMGDHKMGCTGKVPYLTEAEAKHVSRIMTSKADYKVYRCLYLFYGKEHWHVTSMPKATFKRIFKHK